MKKKFDGYLFVSDMDGTLLDSKGNVSERNIQAIKKLSKMGAFLLLRQEE